MKSLRILNIDIENVTFDAFVEQIDSGFVVTPNVDHLMKLQKDRAFYECYQSADHIVCDSRIVQLVSKVLYPGNGIVEQINGSDLFPALCLRQSPNKTESRVFLLGGTEKSVVQAARSLNDRAGRLVVVGAYSPPFGFEHDDGECDRIVDQVNESGANLLAVGVGAPKQELWIHRFRHRMPGVRIFLAIGAAIDFESGRLKRAPRWVVKSGLEWFYRLVQEPLRLSKRYLVDDIPFFWFALKQRFGWYKNPWESR